MLDDEKSDAAPRRGGECPVCGRAAVERHHPFCSRRCADVDLGRWLKGSYHIPGRPLGDEDEGG